MRARTIAGDIRRIRSLMRLGPDIEGCVIRKGDYGELLKLLDSIETKAKRMQDALKPIIDFRPEIRGNYGEEEAWDSDRMMEAMVESRRIYNGGAK